MKKEKNGANRKTAFSNSLLTWYGKSRRDLPWREGADPYRIWISEIMLQQTQVETVIPYYRSFLRRFPDLCSLAEADLADVLKSWENLGYYARARNLHRAAGIIVKEHGGKLPENPRDLLSLPGIGAYSAGAILSLAFGKRCAAVDGNVKRVLARIHGIESPLSDKQTHGDIVGLAEALVPADRSGDFNQAMMDLGATLCTPAAPPLCRVPCSDFLPGFQDRLPIPDSRSCREEGHPRKESGGGTDPVKGPVYCFTEAARGSPGRALEAARRIRL